MLKCFRVDFAAPRGHGARSLCLNRLSRLNIDGPSALNRPLLGLRPVSVLLGCFLEASAFPEASAKIVALIPMADA